MNKIEGSEVEFSRIVKVLDSIGSSLFSRNSDFSIYAAGFAYLSRNELYKLEKTLPLKIVHYLSTRSGFPGLLPLPFSKYFLIKINDIRCANELLNRLGINILLGIFVFSKTHETEFLAEEKRMLKGMFISGWAKIVEKDSTHFYYIVDTDNQECESGMREYSSFGTKAANDLKWLF